MRDTQGMIIVQNVRVGFPHLFAPPMINAELGKCGAILLLDPDKHTDDLAEIHADIAGLTREKLKGRKVPSSKLCLRDGNDSGRAEYRGLLVLKANSKTRPRVISDAGTIIENANDCSIYAGCRVDAKVRLWAQDNQYGKRINAELVAIRFAGDDEPLDGTYVSEEAALEGFDAREGAVVDPF